MNLPPVPPNLERAASWSWRALVCAAAALSVLVVLRYLSVIVLPVMFALTIAPALTPLAGILHKGLGRPAAAIALLFGLAVVAGLIAIVAISVLAQYDELVDSLSQAKDDIVELLEGEPFNLSLETTDDLTSSLAGFSDEAFGYAVAGVQTGLAVVTAWYWQSQPSTSSSGMGRRCGNGSCGGSGRRVGRRSTAPDDTRGLS